MEQPSSPPFTPFQRKGTGNWSVRFSLQGRQIRKSLETDDRRDAERRAHEIWAEAGYRAKNGLNATAMPFTKVAEAFIDQILVEVKSPSALLTQRPARLDSINAILLRPACLPCPTMAISRLNSTSVSTLACFIPMSRKAAFLCLLLCFQMIARASLEAAP